MERKIGEIFEYNGEWYQCVECSKDNYPCIGCYGCKGVGGARINGGECNGNARKDNKFVIFKKLEKVGEPIQIGDKIMQRYKVFVKPYVPKELEYFTIKSARDLTILIEIKQNKENMEEKKLNLKPFDLEAAKAGEPVCTRDGRKARIICFDRKDNMPIVALIECVNGAEILQCYFNNGKCCHDATSDYDLMMLPEKKEGWVNVYKGGLLDTKTYPTKKEAFDTACPVDYVDTVKISWEE